MAMRDYGATEALSFYRLRRSHGSLGGSYSGCSLAWKKEVVTYFGAGGWLPLG